MSGQPPGPASPGRLRVLIADDVLETRRATRIMLSMNPAVEVIAIAHNGRQAVELTRKHMPDMAFMDINMPEMDGLTAMKAMMQIHPDLACIVISAERDTQTLREAIAVGARDYLIKPFTLDQLDKAISRVGNLVRAGQARAQETAKVRRERDEYITQLALEYVKARRTDDKALQVFEYLAADPACELRWLMHLAMLYTFRKDWTKLKNLAIRLELQAQQSKPAIPK